MFPNIGQMPNLDQLTNEQLMQLISNNPQLQQSYQQFVLEQKKNPNLSFKTKPLTSQEYLKLKDIKEFLDPEGGMMIEPTPVIVLKTIEKSGGKIFINVVSHSVIDEPEQKLLIEANNQEGIRIPMSVGSIKEDSDIKGDPCKVVDVVMNPTVVDNIVKDINVRLFFQGLIANYLFEKYKLELSESNLFLFKFPLEFTLPKLKYKGKSISFQRVKGKKPPKIEVVDSKNVNGDEDDDDLRSKKYTSILTILVKKQKQEEYEQEMFQKMQQDTIFKTQSPEWNIFIIYDDHEEEFDGDYILAEVRKIRVEIQLPLLVTGKAIKLRLNSQWFHMQSGRIYELALKFPISIDSNSVQAYFLTEKRLMYFIAPIVINRK